MKDDIYIYPGVTSVLAASSKLGAPIADDLLIVSLSDHLTPYDLIKRRLSSANLGDFVVAIYNPKSHRRKNHLKEAMQILSIRGDLLVGIVKRCYRDDEKIYITKISEMDYDIVDMQTIIIVGNTKTYLKDGKMITPRGYVEKYLLKDKRGTFDGQ
jgi:precorrin-3B C17-methyltransferase